MPDMPLHLPVAELVRQFRARELSPVEVTELALDRIDRLDDRFHAFLSRTDDLARRQAADAERAYGEGEDLPLLGVPVSVKDVFHVAGHITTIGSRVHRDHRSTADSGVVRRLRSAGAVFVGKTNTAEFGQSATTDNLLSPDTRNPWDPERTPGGSSGGAAASVAAGMATLAAGSDGGGSIRIPAAFTGLVGVKPTVRMCPDEDGFAAMEEFVAPGPLGWRVDDVRRMLGVMADTAYPARPVTRKLRVAYCPRPEGRPVQADVAASIERVARLLEEQGHEIVTTELPVDGWKEIFGPLVLDDEARHRGHLLPEHAEELTVYERRSIEAGLELDPADVAAARAAVPGFRADIAGVFRDHDVMLTPTTAVPAFKLGDRPESVDGEPVDFLWGAFPFPVPFNVAGTPAASVPCGLADGLPVGVQLVTAMGHEWELLDIAQHVEDLVEFDPTAVRDRWASRDAEGVR